MFMEYFYNHIKRWSLLLGAVFIILLFLGCSEQISNELANEYDYAEEAKDEGVEGVLTLPHVESIELNGAALQVVATTSIIGNVVAQVGGDQIDLTILMDDGQDPHSYEPAARDLTTISNAHVIFINGFDLEEGLVDDIENIAEGNPIIPISANIDPLAVGEGAHDHEAGEVDEHGHTGIDPHVWFDINNVKKWVRNVEQILSELDPINATLFQSNADSYFAKLEELETYTTSLLAEIPDESRFMVTNHDSFGYLAYAYNLTILGTVIPGATTVSEPSASDLAELIKEMEEYQICTLFTETIVSDSLAQTVAAELDGCANVQIVPLNSGALGQAGSGQDSFVNMFRTTVEAIADGLK